MTTIKPAVVFVTSRLDLPGGTERTLVNVANLLCGNGHPVTILITEPISGSFFPIDKSVKLLTADLNFGITSRGNFLLRKLRLRKDIRELRRMLLANDQRIVIGTDYVSSIASFIAVGKSGFKVLAWEHHHFNWLEKSYFWRSLQKRIYPRLRTVIALNHREAELYKRAGCSTVVIPNFVTQNVSVVERQKKILTVGWLIDRKGVDLIPQIASAVFNDFPDWTWTIVGEGTLEVHLHDEIARHALQDHLFLRSPTSSDADELYAGVSLYVMTSRLECFPMVLLEAMSRGIPAVSFNCPTGPAEIISDKDDGLLVHAGDVSAMIDAVRGLIADADRRQKMSKAAEKNMQRFSPEKIYALWKNLLDTNARP